MIEHETILVGNGPSILERRLGRLIDAHESVVRFNSYRLGPELGDHVGTRTDVWGIKWGTKFQPPVPFPPQTLLLCPWFAGHHGCVWQRWYDIAIAAGHEYLDESIAREAFDWFGRDRWPSSGALAVAHYAERGGCSIIGFDHFTGPRLHYGDDQQFGGWHSPRREWEWFQAFERQGLLRRL